MAFKTFRGTTLPLEVVDRNDFAAKFYHLKVQNLIFSIFHVFDPKMRGEEEAHNGVVGKPIPNCQIPAH